MTEVGSIRAGVRRERHYTLVVGPSSAPAGARVLTTSAVHDRENPDLLDDLGPLRPVGAKQRGPHLVGAAGDGVIPHRVGTCRVIPVKLNQTAPVIVR